MFVLINLSRFLGIRADEALEATNKKFLERFKEIEKFAKSKNINLTDMSLDEMEELWNKAKKLK